MVCKNCGVEINPLEKTCSFCGTAVEENTDISKYSYKDEKITKKRSPLPIVIGSVVLLLIVALAITGYGYT